MRKIVITGVAAVLALGLTACNEYAAPPLSLPTDSAPAPTGTSTPGETSAPSGSTTTTPSAPPAPSGTSTPQIPSSSDTPPTQTANQQIASKWGPLRYRAPGKLVVDNVVFFVATDTILYILGPTCPDGATPPDGKCSIDGIDEWVQEVPRNALVHFSGQGATVIKETR